MASMTLEAGKSKEIEEEEGQSEAPQGSSVVGKPVEGFSLMGKTNEKKKKSLLLKISSGNCPSNSTDPDPGFTLELFRNLILIVRSGQ